MSHRWNNKGHTATTRHRLRVVSARTKAYNLNWTVEPVIPTPATEAHEAISDGAAVALMLGIVMGGSAILTALSRLIGTWPAIIVMLGACWLARDLWRWRAQSGRVSITRIVAIMVATARDQRKRDQERDGTEAHRG